MANSADVPVAVIGLGRIGQVHARNLASRVPGAKLVAVADQRGDVARETARQLGGLRAIEDWREVMADPDIRAVVIATNTPAHAEMALAAMEAGKQVFCEKPLAMDPSVSAELDVASHRTGSMLQVGYQRRFDRGFSAAKRHLEEGRIGQLYLIKLTIHDVEPPSVEYAAGSGGIFRDLTIHDFDLARWFMNDEVVEVFAQGGALIDPAFASVGDADVATASLRFRNGALGVVDASRQSPAGYDVRAEIYGTEGRVMVAAPPLVHTSLWTADAVAHQPTRYSFIEHFDEAYLIELKEFMRCVQTNTPPRVTAADDRMALEIAAAADRSYRSGKLEVVQGEKSY